MANTKGMKMKENKERMLEAEGEMDYDYVNDILLFKVKDRENYFAFAVYSEIL
ncbi:MAG: hypothetical protein Q8P57_03040 [Candidatus Pacearchaeota archaeon]|nr:hypothetical protein [Candidatus Pacearchaeota archaeon]